MSQTDQSKDTDPRAVDHEDTTIHGNDPDVWPRPEQDVDVDRVVTESRTAGPAIPPEAVPPHPLGDDAIVDEPGGPRVVTGTEHVRVADDGTLVREYDRVEHEPPRRRRHSGLVPALLIILALALGAIAAAWYFSRSSTSTVPAVEGIPVNTAVSRVQDEGFKTDIVSESSDAPDGTVFNQDPSAGTEADDGSTVRLFVSKGPADATVPNAVGLSEADARDRLVAAGLQVTSVGVFSDADPGQVVAQTPAAGASAAKGSAVRINVSKGTKMVTVPSVVGSTEPDAVSQVKAAGLQPNVVSVPSAQPAGTVVAQHPTGGQAERGSFVRLNVSKGS